MLQGGACHSDPFPFPRWFSTGFALRASRHYLQPAMIPIMFFSMVEDVQSYSHFFFPIGQQRHARLPRMGKKRGKDFPHAKDLRY